MGVGAADYGGATVGRTQKDPNIDIAGIIDYLNTETDRAVALIATSAVEAALEQFLLRHMVSMASDQRSELFRGTGILATFSAKTKMGFALGLIGPATRTNLDLMREIRNAFDRSHKSITFATPAIKVACQSIVMGAPFISVEAIKMDDSRRRFTSAALVLYSGVARARCINLPHQPPLLT